MREFKKILEEEKGLTMREFKKILEAYKRGDHITDEEMVELRDAYERVANSVFQFGLLYDLVFRDASKNEQQLTGFLRARGVE